LNALEAGLAGDQKAREAMCMAAWFEIHPHYVERLGPEAATIGPPPERRP
jgi:hypothetical protein